mmetsp:Transcript_61780/g.135122  ORF Transcript_61780/g.135122 Transcript_61780/m.135122 type:complete len:161 (+) Transcript_61780:680-1162(+)
MIADELAEIVAAAAAAVTFSSKLEEKLGNANGREKLGELVAGQPKAEAVAGLEPTWPSREKAVGGGGAAALAEAAVAEAGGSAGLGLSWAKASLASVGFQRTPGPQEGPLLSATSTAACGELEAAESHGLAPNAEGLGPVVSLESAPGLAAAAAAAASAA